MARSLFKIGKPGRPQTGRRGPYSTSMTNPRPHPIERVDLVSPRELYDVFGQCNAVNKSIMALRDYVFKEGWEWRPKFSRRCLRCANEHPRDTAPDECDKCGYGGRDTHWFEEADDSITQQMDKIFERIDVNGHTLLEVLKMFEVHLNVIDDGFLVVSMEYDLDDDGNITNRTWTDDSEITVADPLEFQMVLHEVTKRPGGAMWICLAHRPAYGIDATTAQGYVSQTPGRCEQADPSRPDGRCNRKLHDVWYVALGPHSTRHIGVSNGYGTDYLGYYTRDEVIHESKYGLAYGYGHSPIIPVIEQARTLLLIERHMRRWYENERAPRGALFIPTNRPDEVREMYREMDNRAVSEGTSHTQRVTYPPGEGGGVPTYVRFSELPEEMQLLEYRDECYRRIGSAFDVAPVFHGNVDAVGLQSQGPTQFQVTVLGAQKAAWIYNNKVFPKLLKLFGVKDWELWLREPEEVDEMQKLQVEALHIQNAIMLSQIGYVPTRRTQEGTFEFPETATSPMDLSMAGEVQEVKSMALQNAAMEMQLQMQQAMMQQPGGMQQMMGGGDDSEGGVEEQPGGGEPQPGPQPTQKSKSKERRGGS